MITKQYFFYRKDITLPEPLRCNSTREHLVNAVSGVEYVYYD